MTFEERNARWTGDVREFHQPHSRSGTPRVWTIGVVGNAVHTTWGQLNGKMQAASEYFEGVNEGKANYMGPAAYALDRAREMCRKKNWEGYREIRPNQSASIVYLDQPVVSEIDFNKPLPLSLSFYKPDNTLSPGLERKAKVPGLWYTRKRNGMMKVLCKGYDGELKIYSRRMLRQHDDETGTEYTWDDRFPHIIHVVEPHIPPGTILLGELAVEDDGGERFDLAQSYIKSLTPKAVQDMETSGLFPFFYCWDVAFWEGQNLVGTTGLRDRVPYIDTLEQRIASPHFEALIRLSFPSPESAVGYAKEVGWEGFVVVDPDGIYGDRAFNFKGKPDRPGKFCGKLKPSYESDFVVMWDPDKGYGERSTKGRYDMGIKSVALFQYNKKGELVFISNLSSGMTEEMKTGLADPRLYPRVWQVEYTERTYQSEGDKTNALTFARFVREREDKHPSECVDGSL